MMIRFASIWLYVATLSLATCFAEEKKSAPQFTPSVRCAVGFRTDEFSYVAENKTSRKRSLCLWYPTTAREQAVNYKGQNGFAAENGEVAPGEHPLVLFSHGFFGAADQTIFLCEALARAGYIVVAPNHADALKEAWNKKVDIPNFADAKSWDDTKHFDRKEDFTALLDQLTTPSLPQKSFLTGHVDAQKIGAVGHSLGGYTVLGMSGARQSWKEPRIKAAVLYSPYALPFIEGDKLRGVNIPLLMQGGTLDLGITPFLQPIYRKLPSPKYYLILKNETHFAWTNFNALGKTTKEAIQEGNNKWMYIYTVAFLDHYVRQTKASPLLTASNNDLWSYRFEAK